MYYFYCININSQYHFLIDYGVTWNKVTLEHHQCSVFPKSMWINEYLFYFIYTSSYCKMWNITTDGQTSGVVNLSAYSPDCLSSLVPWGIGHSWDAILEGFNLEW